MASGERSKREADEFVLGLAANEPSSITDASEAIMIGDRLDNDINPARRLGMKTIWNRQGRYSIMEPRTPDETPNATVSDVREVLDAVVMVNSRLE